MATAKIQTGLRLAEPLYEKVTVLAKLESRSLNNLIEYVLERYVADYEAKNGPVLPIEKE